MINFLNIKDGIIIYDDLSHIKNDMDFYENSAMMSGCNMFQVSFYEKYLIDVDWTPIGDINGHFVVVVIQDLNWSEYLFEKNARTYDELISTINEAVEFIYAQIADGK